MAKQVSMLLYCLGEESGSVNLYKYTEEQRRVYKTVMEKFDEFFEARRNVIFERTHFNQHCQQDGETAELFIMELYRSAEYGTMKDEMQTVLYLNSSKWILF